MSNEVKMYRRPLLVAEIFAAVARESAKPIRFVKKPRKYAAKNEGEIK